MKPLSFACTRRTPATSLHTVISCWSEETCFNLGSQVSSRVIALDNILRDSGILFMTETECPCFIYSSQDDSRLAEKSSSHFCTPHQCSCGQTNHKKLCNCMQEGFGGIVFSSCTHWLTDLWLNMAHFIVTIDFQECSLFFWFELFEVWSLEETLCRFEPALESLESRLTRNVETKHDWLFVDSLAAFLCMQKGHYWFKTEK